MKKNDVLVRFATLQSVCNQKKKNGSCLESGCLCREEKCPVVFLRAQDLDDYSDLREISEFAKDIYNTFFEYDLEDVEYYKSKVIIEKQRRENIQNRLNLAFADFKKIAAILKKYEKD